MSLRERLLRLAAELLSLTVSVALVGCDSGAPAPTDVAPTAEPAAPAEVEPASTEPAPAEEPMPAAETAAAPPAPAGEQVAAAGTAPAATPSAGSTPLDPELPEYKPVAGVSGTLKSVGSDSMNNLMAYWAEGFRKFYPGVRIEVEGKGSSTAPPALIAGTAQFGPMSRDMKAAEVAAFKDKFGYEPTLMRTGVDSLAVFVHKNNPLESLTLAEVDAIFSETRRRGREPIATWAQAGVEGPLANRPVSLYGRNAASGTYGFFKEKALQDGDFKPSVKEQPGSSAVVQGVAGDEAGIGYSGIGYKTPNVKAIRLGDGGEAVEPTAENVYAQKYPLTRFLNLYVNAKPNADLDPLRREFLKYIFSRQGQESVVKDGYYPVPAALAARELEKVGIKAGASN